MSYAFFTFIFFLCFCDMNSEYFLCCIWAGCALFIKICVYGVGFYFFLFRFCHGRDRLVGRVGLWGFSQMAKGYSLEGQVCGGFSFLFWLVCFCCE